MLGDGFGVEYKDRPLKLIERRGEIPSTMDAPMMSVDIWQ